MPNRIIKESICTSDNINNLLPAVEIFFYRLIVNCDDYGRFHASPAILRAKCFPWRTDDISLDDMNHWLAALVEENLITLYVSKGKQYLQMVTWEKHQQIRARKSKFPAPDDDGSNLISIDINGNQPISLAPVIQSNPIVIQSESNAVAERENKENSRTSDYVKFYINNINISAKAFEIGTLTKYEEEGMDPAVILKAVEEAVLGDARNLKYITRVLNDWYKAGVTNLEQLKAYQEQWNQKKAKAPRKGQGQAKPLQQTNEFGEDKFDLLSWGKFGEGGN